MLRMTGGALLLGACMALGLGAVQGLRARVAHLQGFIAALEEMARELGCRLTPMPELLGRLREGQDGPVGEFFALCSDGLARLDRRSFSQLWQEALEAAGLCLETEDLQHLAELGGSLGRYDSRRQCEAILQTRDRLEKNLQAALERRERLGRVYAALGLATGAILVIILL